MSVSKETLRREARNHRNRIDPCDRAEDPESACALFFEHIKPRRGQVVALYWPSGREFDSGPVMEKLLKEGIDCALPVMTAEERILKFALWDDTEPLTEGPHKIMQPAVNERTRWADPDIVAVPLLAFDRRGYRLGQGGGHYDATLRDLRRKKDILAVGLAYAQQAVLFNLPVGPCDERLDWVITPQKAHCYKD